MTFESRKMIFKNSRGYEFEIERDNNGSILFSKPESFKGKKTLEEYIKYADVPEEQAVFDSFNGEIQDAFTDADETTRLEITTDDLCVVRGIEKKANAFDIPLEERIPMLLELVTNSMESVSDEDEIVEILTELYADVLSDAYYSGDKRF